MAITIGIAKNEKYIRPNPFAVLDDELMMFFKTLVRFPAFQKLASLDPYGDTILSSNLCDELADELPELLSEVENQTKAKQANTVGPIAFENEEENKTLGFTELRMFLDDFEVLLSAEGTLLAIGD